jgi:hypothetical protein
MGARTRTVWGKNGRGGIKTRTSGETTTKLFLYTIGLLLLLLISTNPTGHNSTYPTFHLITSMECLLHLHPH